MEANLSGIDTPKSRRSPLMSETPIAQRLVSVPAAAAAIGVSPRNLWRIMSEGGLPCVRIGGRTMISVADLDAFIAQQRGPFTVAAA
jgi:hypothetical protein